MRLHTLHLNQFRLYEHSAFKFSSDVNCIYGENAAGKTTILEAIFYLMTGKSFRTSNSKEMIRKGEEGFAIEAGFTKHGVDQKVKITVKGKEKRIIYNSTLCQSTASLLGLLQGVVITPDDVAMIKGSPSLRRQYLDLQLAQADPLYVHHITRYHRAMRQRNTLLRAKNLCSIESWEMQMASSAEYVTRQRSRLVAELTPIAREIYAELSGQDPSLALLYKTMAPDSEIKDYYVELFKKMRHREVVFGNTLHGPHKDDLVVTIGEQDTRHYASEGQQRSSVIALKFAEWERLKLQSDEPPLILLDDIGACLDAKRQERLFSRLESFDQVFLTSTEEYSFRSINKDVHKLPLSI